MNQLTSYFNAEKFESLFFVGIGVIAITFGIYFFLSIKTPFYKGMAYPLLAVGLIQLVVGWTVYVRSPKDIERVKQMMANTREKIGSEEIPRMKVVVKNFVIYRFVEIALIVLGLIGMFLFKPNEWVNGLSLGLVIQAALMLSLDFFAEKRAHDYLEFLNPLQI